MKVLYLVPVLLAVEYRMRLGPVSFAVAELAVVVVWLLVLQRQTGSTEKNRTVSVIPDVYLISLVLFCSLPGLIFDLDAKHAMSAVRDLMWPLLLFLGLRFMDLDPEEIKALVAIYIAVAIVSSVLGIVQFQTGRFAFFESPDAAAWEEYKLGFIVKSVAGEWLGVKDALPVGFFSHPNNFGSYVMIPLIVAFSSIVLIGTPSSKGRWVQGLGVVVMLAALTGTFFRTGIVFILLSMVALGGLKRLRVTGSLKALFFGGGVALAAVLFMMLDPSVLAFDQFGTVTGRSEMIQHALQTLGTHPWMALTGGLSDDYKRLFDEPQEVHNWILYGILRFGVFTTISLLAIYFLWLKRFVRLFKEPWKKPHAILAGITCGLIGHIFVLGLATSLLDNVSINLGLMFWLGIGAAIYANLTTRAAQPAYSQ